MKIILTGLNGYGSHFIEPLLEEESKDQLVAVVSRNPENSNYYKKLKEKNISFYKTIEECLLNEEADVAMITTPMHIHYKEVMCALSHKVSVLCEKPATTTTAQCMEIMEYAKKQGCHVAVGYQWSYSKGILDLKRVLLEGKFGRLTSAKAIVNWNRPKTYFSESNWKGRKRGANGEPINDSVLSNCTSHFIHNLLFLAGEQMHTDAEIKEITGECYVAHAIETFDTCYLSMITKNNIPLYYMATMVSDQSETPKFELICEHAKITYPVGEEGRILVKKDTAEEVYYDCPNNQRFTYFREVFDCIRNNKQLPCDVATVLPDQKLVDFVTNTIEVIPFPKETIRETDEIIEVQGLKEHMQQCYRDESIYYK
ncbi:MAG: Gfo/Idh/MocA family oxidoreductase [bacterium]|nr:Gfo/Idh/MocA family oxidoreductase [bacterium]